MNHGRAYFFNYVEKNALGPKAHWQRCSATRRGGQSPPASQHDGSSVRLLRCKRTYPSFFGVA